MIVSIVVIGILAAIVMLNISDLRLQAEETAYAVNSKEVQSAVDRYKMEYGKYPTTPQPTKDNPQEVVMDKIVPKFLRSEPKGDYTIEVDEKGETTIIRNTPEDGEGNIPGEVVEEVEEPEPPYVPIASCEEAIGQGYICITNEEEFNDIRNNLEGKYILMDNIDLVSFGSWSPIGSSTAPFSGELNGNNFTISNMSITNYSTLDVGLFGVVRSGVFQNITLSNFTLDNSTTGLGDLRVGGLIGRVEADGTNNPDKNGLTLKNIQGDVSAGLNSTAATKRNDYLGGLVGYITNNADIIVSNVNLTIQHTSVEGYVGGVVGGIFTKVGTESTNVSFKWITIGGNFSSTKPVTYTSCISWCNHAGGIIGIANLSNALTGAFTIKNVTVNADMTGAYVSGIVYLIRITDDYDSVVTLIEKINVNGFLTGDNTASGLTWIMFAANTTIKDITVTSNMKGKSTYGLGEEFYTNYWNSPGGDYVTIENINITSTMDYRTRANGLYFELYLYQVLGDITIRNIDVNVNMLNGEYVGGQAVGFIDTLDFNPSGNVLITDVNVQGLLTGGTVVGLAEWLFPTYGNYHVSSGVSENFELSNVTVSAELRAQKRHNPNYGKPRWTGGPIDTTEFYTGTVYGLLGYGNNFLTYNKTLFKDILVSGNMSVDYGKIYGLTNYLDIVLETDVASFEMNNVDITSSMQNSSGDIFPFVEYWEVERTSDGAYWYYQTEDYSATPLVDLDAFILHNNSIPASGNMTAPSGTIHPGLYNK